jgi:hypothetical protein
MIISTGCKKKETTATTDPDLQKNETINQQDTPEDTSGVVRYSNAAFEVVTIKPITEPSNASEIGDEEALELLGMLYRNYSIVDAWFMRTPGDLVVDTTAQAEDGTYYPVKDLTSSAVTRALHIVFGGEAYIPSIYNRDIFRDINGKFYIDTGKTSAGYRYLPDINYATIVEKTETSVTYAVPVINEGNAIVGNLTMIATNERDVWTFSSDIQRDIDRL